MKALRTMMFICFSVVALLLGILAFILFSLDPNEHRQKITELVEEQLPVTLSLGQLSWHFFPWIGIDAGKTTLTTEQNEPLISVDYVDISVDLLSLLSGKIKASTIKLVKPQILYTLDASAISNWDKLIQADAEGTQQPSATQETPPAQTPEIEIETFLLENAAFTYKDASQAQSVTLNPINLRLTHFSLNKPFNLTLDFIFKDASNLEIKSNLTADIQLDLNQEFISTKHLKLEAKISGLMEKPLTIQTDINTRIDLAKELVTFTESTLSLPPLTLTINGSVEQFQTTPEFSFEVNSNEVSLSQMMKDFGIPALNTNPNALAKFSLDTKLSGNPNELTLLIKRLIFDETQASGQIEIKDFSQPKIQSNLQVSQINLDQYLPDSSTETETPQPTAKQTDEASPLIPMDALRALNFGFTANIEKIILKKIPIEQLQINAKGDEGLIQISKIDGRLLGGSFANKGSLDVRGETPKLVLQQRIDTLNIGQLNQSVSGLDFLEGLFSFNANFASEGNSLKALSSALNGASEISFNEGLLKGISLSGLAYEKLGSWSAIIEPLLSKNEQIPSPKVLRKNTEINDLFSKLVIESGHIKAKEISGGIDGNANILGSASLNTQSGEINLDLNLKLDKSLSNPYLAKIDWPISCSGLINFDTKESPVPNCTIKADTVKKQIGRMVEKKAKADLKQKAESKLAEKLKSKLNLSSESETGVKPKELLKTKEDEVKQEAKEKLNKEINKGLEKLFKF